MSEVEVTLPFSDGPSSVELPIYKDTVGSDAIDIYKLYGQMGKFTHSPGFMSTVPYNSKTIHIDDDKGELLYHGYAIDDLASERDLTEICHPLLKNELSDARQKEEFNHAVTNHTMVRKQIQFSLRGFHYDAHPMAIPMDLAGATSAFYPDAASINDPREREVPQIRLITKLLTLVAMAYKYNIGQPLIYPQNNLSYTGNFIRMMFATPCEDHKVNPMLEKILDRVFILHADHEQNASTLTVRLAGSSGINPIAAITAGIACLRGSVHGGTNGAALNMLEEIGTVDKVSKFIKQVKDKNSGVRLMGFGYYAYRNHDPRVKLMRETCHEVLNELGLHNSPLFKLAMELERIALEDKYFANRKLYPNVDFYSGIVQRALGTPTSMFTYTSASVRSVSWISQWEEMTTDSEYRVGRPRQLFNGIVTHRMPSIDKR